MGEPSTWDREFNWMLEIHGRERGFQWKRERNIGIRNKGIKGMNEWMRVSTLP